MKTYLLSAVSAFAISFVFLLVLIPILRRVKVGQNILSYVKEHEAKGGTPTMGGIAFVLAAIIASVLFIRTAHRDTLLALVIGLSYMLVGLLDDFLKRAHKENLGLRAWQKLAFQVLIALFCGVYCLRVGATELYLPFTAKRVSIGWWILPLSIFTFVATVNAVNLTDGLDGLAASTSVPFFLALALVIHLQNGSAALAVLCFCLVGAIVAYLCFNLPPASVFMGDTGSLALGGFAAAIATFSGNALYILILGACFVFSVISVLLQVIYYKATGGRRIFLMAPVHHHFQQKGYSETRISYAYFTVTLLLGTLCVIALL
ncbi:MAG: phospho-N-acetylmuramoyl-pentapeptide-transferase [Clostridia bacterium]|nr:phospho-N-acetylmuramoyl-pentapeptide-transferase [Clostridia bacterium]